MTTYWESLLGASPGPDRENRIMELVRKDQHVPWRFFTVRSEHGGHVGEFLVLEDVVALRGEDWPGNAEQWLRVSMAMTTAQLVVDHIGETAPQADGRGAYLLTPHLVDLVAAQATVRLEPIPRGASSEMASTLWIEKQHEQIEAARAGRVGPCAPCGKDFVLDDRLALKPDRCAIYGWHARTGKPIQPVYLGHFAHFTDYSQKVRCVLDLCVVDGQRRSFPDIAQDPELCGLVSDAGPLQVLRHPAVDPPWMRADTEPRMPALSTPTPPQPREEQPTPVDSAIPPKPRTLRKGMTGPDVAAWQRKLMKAGWSLAPYHDDGDFGGLTEARTIAATGKDHVPPGAEPRKKTQSSARPAVRPGDEPGVPLVQARNYTPANRSEVRWIVIHTMEAAEEYIRTAENVANWFAGADAPKASAHYNVDRDSIVQSVREVDVAWHAKGGNRYGIGIEHAGYARQSELDWADGPSQEILTRSARLTASIAKRWGIPPVRLSDNDLRNGLKGFCGHGDITRAFKIAGGHTDPGAGFPWSRYLDMVKSHL